MLRLLQLLFRSEPQFSSAHSDSLQCKHYDSVTKYDSTEGYVAKSQRSKYWQAHTEDSVATTGVIRRISLAVLGTVAGMPQSAAATKMPIASASALTNCRPTPIPIANNDTAINTAPAPVNTTNALISFVRGLYQMCPLHVHVLRMWPRHIMSAHARCKQMLVSVKGVRIIAESSVSRSCPLMISVCAHAYATGTH
jgi:hypothetical protein